MSESNGKVVDFKKKEPEQWKAAPNTFPSSLPIIEAADCGIVPSEDRVYFNLVQGMTPWSDGSFGPIASSVGTFCLSHAAALRMYKRLDKVLSSLGAFKAPMTTESEQVVSAATGQPIN